jgi:hypothetical protein
MRDGKPARDDRERCDEDQEEENDLDVAQRR